MKDTGVGHTAEGIFKRERAYGRNNRFCGLDKPVPIRSMSKKAQMCHTGRALGVRGGLLRNSGWADDFHQQAHFTHDALVGSCQRRYGPTRAFKSIYYCAFSHICFCGDRVLWLLHARPGLHLLRAAPFPCTLGLSRLRRGNLPRI